MCIRDRAVGDMDKFLKFKAATALSDAANNPGGGAASDGVGVGAGMGMGFMLPQMLAGAMQGGQQQGGGQQGPSPMDKLKKLKELLDLGALSQEEYDAKKDKLLGEI